MKSTVSVMLFLALVACSSGPDPKVEQQREAATKALAAADDEIRQTARYVAELSDEISPQLTDSVATEVARASQSELDSDETEYASNMWLFQNGGGAGMAAKFAAEDRMRDKRKRALERQIDVKKRGVVLLEAKKTFLEKQKLAEAKGSSLSLTEVAASADALLNQERSALSWLFQRFPSAERDGQSLLARVDASSDRLGRAVSSYNKIALFLGKPALAARVALPVAPQAVAPAKSLTVAPPQAPALTTAYLRGTWGPNANKNPSLGCDTDVIVTFKKDGTYSDAGTRGRYRIVGQRVTYYDRKAVENAEEGGSEAVDATMTSVIVPVGPNQLREDGDMLYRCTSS